MPHHGHASGHTLASGAVLAAPGSRTVACYLGRQVCCWPCLACAKEPSKGATYTGQRSEDSLVKYIPRISAEFSNHKALLPVLVCVIVKVDAFGTARFNSSTDTRSAEKAKNGDTRLLTVLTVSALVALSYVSELRATFALGCCNAVLVAVVLSLLQTAHRETVSTDTNDGVISVSGLLSQPTIRKDIQQVLVDVSFAAALAQWMSAFLLEGFSTRPFWFAFLPQQILMVVLGIGMVIVHVMLNRSMILVVSRPRR